MPFTPAHVALVLPFVRSRYFSATALVIGSMAPDFEYFFKMSVYSAHSHTLLGLVYFNVPVVVSLSVAFHQVVKRNLIINLPVWLQRRCSGVLALNWTNELRTKPLVILYSALIGAASHILWDSFTHQRGYFVKILPAYNGSVVPFDGVNYPLFYALQHISTVVGLLVVILYVILQKPVDRSHLYAPSAGYWILLTAFTLGGIGIRFALKASDLDLGNFVVTAISSFCLALVLCGFINFRQYGKEISMDTGR